jgi:uncharacterized protein DUF2752
MTTAARWRGVRTPVLLATAALAAAVLLQVRDPHLHGSYGFCPWLALTGTACPLCGGLRAVNDLGRGDVVAAASSNLLLVASLPVLAAVWLRSLAAGWRGRGSPYDDRTVRLLLLTGVGLTVAFWVVRNLPVAAWLMP